MSLEGNNQDLWAVVELMGHKIVAGLVSKSEILGIPLLRVDVPATTAFPEFTQQFGGASIYCVTFVSEEVARRTAESIKANPVNVYAPDLITKERYEADMNEYRKRLEQLRRGLPAPDEDQDEDRFD